MNPLEKPPFNKPAIVPIPPAAMRGFKKLNKLKCEIRAIDREIDAILKAELTRAKAGKIPFQP
jgi:hypothetical protein